MDLDEDSILPMISRPRRTVTIINQKLKLKTLMGPTDVESVQQEAGS
jgi:hypothetical protein